jgi:hypothetical protein
MRKSFVLILILLTGLSLGAVSLDLGLSYGSRSLADGKYEPIFGAGTVFCPELSVNLFKGLTVGALMESGYDRDGVIGSTDKYDSNLKVSGFEGFVGYTYDVGRFHPFVRVGFGSYKYEQTLTPQTGSPALPAGLDKFEETKGTVSFGGGLKVDLVKGLYLGGQLRYVPLKLTPKSKNGFDFAELDLGGLRYMLTLGYRFDF